MSKFTTGWQLMVLGMGIVFLMLLLLSIIIKYLGKYLSPEKKLKQPANQVEIEPEDNEKRKKVAAVMAAIQVVMGDIDYQIISIKPINSSTWKKSLNLGGHEFKYGGRKGK